MSFLDDNEDIILRAICDVNPQVCRNICNILHLSNKKESLKDKIIEKIIELIEKTKSLKTKSHKASKDIFNLYWNIMALENLVDNNVASEKIFHSIILQTLEYKDYTIRERGAYLFKKIGLNSDDILQKIKNDSNFYVKNAL